MCEFYHFVLNLFVEKKGLSNFLGELGIPICLTKTSSKEDYVTKNAASKNSKSSSESNHYGLLYEDRCVCYVVPIVRKIEKEISKKWKMKRWKDNSGFLIYFSLSIEVFTTVTQI